jgi:hypothetical protein
MKYLQNIRTKVHKITILIFLVFLSNISHAQSKPKISFGVHIDPLISWFGSDNDAVSNKGSRPGFNFGLTYYRYFGPNYAFSSGISIISAGGRLVNSDTVATIMELNNNKNITVLPDESVIYKIQYLSLPFGLKLQTNQIGYLTFFTDLGLDPKVVVGGKVKIDDVADNDKATSELKLFNLGYHALIGLEYAVGGNTAIVVGLNFENNFLDITTDKKGQPNDKISHRLLSFRLGVNF